MEQNNSRQALEIFLTVSKELNKLSFSSSVFWADHALQAKEHIRKSIELIYSLVKVNPNEFVLIKPKKVYLITTIINGRTLYMTNKGFWDPSLKPIDEHIDESVMRFDYEHTAMEEAGKRIQGYPILIVIKYE